MPNMSEFESQSPTRAARNVSTTLNYMKAPTGGLQTIEDNSSNSNGRNIQREGIDDVREVVIHNIRGREEEFTLDVQGFQYIKHEVDGMTNWRDETQVKQIVQPATEALIKEVWVFSSNSFCELLLTVTAPVHRRSLSTSLARGLKVMMPATK